MRSLARRFACPLANPRIELDKNGRNWVKDNKVTLLRPQNVEECFKLLNSGSVNAVVTPDLTGKSVAAGLGLADKVKALSRPVAIGTLHVIVPKSHPHASTMLYYINTAVGYNSGTAENTTRSSTATCRASGPRRSASRAGAVPAEAHTRLCHGRWRNERGNRPSPQPSPRKLALASLHLSVAASASRCGWRGSLVAAAEKASLLPWGEGQDEGRFPSYFSAYAPSRGRRCGPFRCAFPPCKLASDAVFKIKWEGHSPPGKSLY